MEVEGISQSDKDKIFDELCEITGELFKAATTVDKLNFQPLDNAIEIFGVDFLVDEDCNVFLLEANSYPDFKQTGDDLKDLIYKLFKLVAGDIVDPLLTKSEKPAVDGNLKQVF